MKFSNLIYSIFPNRCPYCNKVINKEEISCRKCRKHFPKYVQARYTTGLNQCISSLPYVGIFSNAVKFFKFNGKKGYSHPLGKLMAKDIKREYADIYFDFITAVPLHKKRFEDRGYNQSEILAKVISKEIKVPYIETLIKKRNNKVQHTLTAKEREANVKGAYKVITKDIIKDKNILIIDDIITTGYTLTECTDMLLKAGAKSVYSATLCSVDFYY